MPMNYAFSIHLQTSQEGVRRHHIDPVFKGNVARFINHSCAPNLHSQLLHCGSTLPKIALFAETNIEAFTPLSFSYGRVEVTTKSKEVDWSCLSVWQVFQLIFDDVTSRPCHCNSENCQKYLPNK